MSQVQLIFKGQLNCQDKLTSITRFCSPKNSFEGIFEKFVFEIWPVEIFVNTDQKTSEKGRGNVCSMPRVTCTGLVISETIFELIAGKIYQR